MKKNNKKVQSYSLEKDIKIYYIILFALAFIFIVQFAVLGILYLYNKENDAIRLSLFIVSITLLVVIIAYVVFIVTRYSRMFYGGLYKNTLNNYRKIIAQEKEMTKYINTHNYSELNELNKTLDDINDFYDKIIINNGDLDYESVGLEFVEGFEHVVTYDSFVANYKKVIDVSNNFRHAFISFQYPRNQRSLSSEEFNLFILTVRRNFKYQDVLIVVNDKVNEYLLYVPRFDSLSYLKEGLEKCVEKFCINRNTEAGYELINCNINCVVYPYSHYNDIFTDLQYAKRQGNNVFVYLPNKPNISENLILSDSRNTSVISRSLEKLTSSTEGNASFIELNNKVDELFQGICSYFDFDLAGVVTYDEFQNVYVNSFAYGKDNDKNSIIPTKFVELLVKHKDSDGTLYFSSRKSVSQDIGKMVDRFGIESGHYYVFSTGSTTDGFVYFTRSTTSSFDSYIRESLLVFSFYISNYLYRIKSMKDDYFRLTQLHDILKITGCALYSVNSNDFSILSYSPELKQLLPHMEVGQKCYEALCGRTKRCEKCPLKSGKKVVNTIKDIKFESSLALTRPGSVETSILLSPIEGDTQAIRERYDHELLVKSYYSFFQAMKDSFMISERGYILVMNIDNMKELVTILQSEQLNSYLRAFFDDVRDIASDLKFELYLLSNDSFAIVVPNSNNNNVIDLAEKVYGFSQKNYHIIKDNEVKMNLSYFVIAYPFGYQNPNDYAKFVKNNSIPHDDLYNKNFIYVLESKYARSASHEKYLLDILDTSITTNTFKVKLQPVVNKLTKKIISTELLFRIADVNRGGEISTYEVINAAASEKKIYKITSLIVKYLETLFEEHDKDLIKKFNLKRLALNVDYSFFEDEGFFKEFLEAKEKYKMSDDMIQFEISEKEVAKNINNIKSVLQNIKATNSFLICDNYTGELLSLDKIKDLGFNGIKIGYKLTSQIENNTEAYNGLCNIIETSNSIGLEPTVVGVESASQNRMLLEYKEDFNIQGYYYYRPLEEQELLNALLKSKI